MKKHINFLNLSIAATIIMIIFSWYYISSVTNVVFSEVFSEENLSYSKKFLDGLLGKGEDLPAFKDINRWKEIASLTYETLVMSVLAIAISTLGMFLTVFYGARNIANGSLFQKKKRLSYPLYFLVRGVYIFTRAVPELIWAMIVIFIFKPGILPGAIALAIHNFGIVGKLCSEVIENMDENPIKSLYSSGSTNSQMLFYGVLPMALPKFMTYIIYRWEVIIRTTIVVGLVGAGGLGRQFRLSMSYFNYSEITLIIIAYLLLVFLADLVSKLTRYLSN